MKPRTRPTTSAAEGVEGRRLVVGKASCNACSGPSAGQGMSPKRRACGPGVQGPFRPRTSVAFDLRQEPGAGKPHAGICGGGAGKPAPLPDQVKRVPVTTPSGVLNGFPIFLKPLPPGVKPGKKSSPDERQPWRDVESAS